ncbi:hypothetical protein HY500_02645 [Candidatus Woesearchaeota archaeon]|nr:hypothetical protein [Candidatus Woesearchaeota archaeon]
MKGQTSTEYLIILGVVIVVALIVVAALGGLPGVGENASVKTSKLFWNTKALVGFKNYAVTSVGNDTFVLKNNLDSPVKLDNVKINSVDVPVEDATLSPGNTMVLTYDVGSCVLGQNYEYEVLIGYTDLNTGANYTYTGDGTNLVGTCSGEVSGEGSQSQNHGNETGGNNQPQGGENQTGGETNQTQGGDNQTQEYNITGMSCGNGLDNDWDGKIDYPTDLGCANIADNDESDPYKTPVCGNGFCELNEASSCSGDCPTNVSRCYDSDDRGADYYNSPSGMNYFSKGTVTSNVCDSPLGLTRCAYGSSTDNNNLEYSCAPNGLVRNTYFSCNIYINGTCKDQLAVPPCPAMNLFNLYPWVGCRVNNYNTLYDSNTIVRTDYTCNSAVYSCWACKPGYGRDNSTDRCVLLTANNTGGGGQLSNGTSGNTTQPSGNTTSLSNTSITYPNSGVCYDYADYQCPNTCAAGSDYDCCTSSGKVWYQGYGCYPAGSTVGQCLATSDGICQSSCAAGSDYDCCVASGKTWYDGYGCYASGLTFGTCSATSDGICQANCAAGSDYDCCVASGKCWRPGQGCYSTC